MTDLPLLRTLASAPASGSTDDDLEDAHMYLVGELYGIDGYDPDVDALIAEVRRLRSNPDCPSCKHSVTEEHFAPLVRDIMCNRCNCVDWKVS